MSQIPTPFDPHASLTAGLVEMIHAKAVSTDDLYAAAMFSLDAIANIIGGLASTDLDAVRTWAAAEPLNTGRKSFVLGAASAVLEMDAMHRASSVHAGTNVVPAVMAWCDGQRESGRRFLGAVLKGSEAAFRIGKASGPAHYKIYQTSATCGVYGAAMATSLLLGLDKRQTVHALGNAGTQSSGLWEFRETGAMTKQLHAARAAESGVLAAQLAQHGFTGPLKVLEGARGFFKAACPDAAPDAVLSGQGSPWELGASSVKPWPSSRHSHAAIDAALGAAGKVAGRRIGLIEVDTYQTAIDLCGNVRPASAHQAKSSLAYCVVAALLDGRVDLDSFTADTFARHRDLTEKVVVRAAEPYISAFPKSWGAAVKVTFEDGTVEISRRDETKGDPEAPMSTAELKAKATDLLRLGGVNAPDRLIAEILDMAEGGPVPAFPLPWTR